MPSPPRNKDTASQPNSARPDSAHSVSGQLKSAWPQSAWVISDGTIGMLSQSLAIVRAMDIHADDIRLSPPPLLRLFPRLASIPGWQLTWGREPDWLKQAVYPDLLITTGRRMAGISIGIRRRSRGKTKTIHIQDPKLPSKFFDLLILPQHDRPNGALAENELLSTGSLNRIITSDLTPSSLSPEEIAAIPQTIQNKFIAVLLGGTTKNNPVNNSLLARFIEQTGQLADQLEASLLILPSRRTPANILVQFETGLKTRRFHIWNGEGENPYLAALSMASAVIISEDSVNMTSEACITGKPVLTAPVTALSGRIASFHQHMQAHHHTMRLEDAVSSKQIAAPVILDEMASIASQIYHRLGT